MNVTAPGKTWGGTSDPQRHDPQAFRYVVYSFHPYAKLLVLQGDRAAAATGARPGEDAEARQAVDLFEQPERVAEKLSLSMSLIDSTHRATWGAAGLILQVPEQNVILTSPVDANTRHSFPEVMEYQALQTPQRTPDELLRQTSETRYNEVVAAGKSTSGELKVIGFFVKVDDEGLPLDDVLAQRVREHSIRMKLPIVSVEAPALYRDELVDAGESGVVVQTRGRQFVLPVDMTTGSLTGDSFDSRGHGLGGWMTPDEVRLCASVVRRLRPDLDTTVLVDAYGRADAARQRPTVLRDFDGQIVGIFQQTGYKDGETNHVLPANGHARHVNCADEQRVATGQRMAGALSYRREDGDGSRPMPPQRAQVLVDAAIESTDATTQTEILRFWDETAPLVQERWDKHLEDLRIAVLPDADARERQPTSTSHSL